MELPEPSKRMTAACQKMVRLLAEKLTAEPHGTAYNPEAQFVAVVAGAYQARAAKMLSDDNFQKILRHYGGKTQKIFLDKLSADASFMTLVEMTVVGESDREAMLAQVSAMWTAGVFNSIRSDIAAFPDCRENLARNMPPGMVTPAPAESGNN